MSIQKSLFCVWLAFIFNGSHAADRAWDLLKDAQFKKSYPVALGRYAQALWLAKLGGPSWPNTTIEIDGNTYVLFGTCKQHECDTSNMLGIYSKKRNSIYGLILSGGKLYSYGNPPDKIKSQLHAIYIRENPQHKNIPLE